MRKHFTIDEIVEGIIEDIIFALEGDLAIFDMLEDEASERGEHLDLSEDYEKVKYIQDMFVEGNIYQGLDSYLNHTTNTAFNLPVYVKLSILAKHLNFPIERIKKIKLLSY